MPKGPQGQKRPADAIGLAVLVGKIATGEVEDKLSSDTARRRNSSKGGKARAEKLSAAEKQSIAEEAAKLRWAKTR